MVLRLPDSWSNWNLEMLVFEERGKPEYPEKNLSEQGRTNNKLNPHMASTPGFEPGPHWWEASALTTVPPLLPSWLRALGETHSLLRKRSSLFESENVRFWSPVDSPFKTCFLEVKARYIYVVAFKK